MGGSRLLSTKKARRAGRRKLGRFRPRIENLGLAGQYTEKDVEQAFLRELNGFILELATHFAFVAHQKRMTQIKR